MKKITLFFIVFLMFSVNCLFSATTGKITGKVVEAESGEPLPGANVIIQGTMMGAATNLDGQYVILNIPPGTYNLKATMMGYTSTTLTEVRVKIDQTTIIDFQLKTEILAGEEVVITAVRPVVEKDVAASKANITAEQIADLPFASVTEVMGIQAGISSGLGIRGGSSNEVLFMVDGVGMRDSRNDEPFTAVPLSAVQEVSVQSGGMGAEYSSTRSGVVNIVTKEGDKDSYSASVTIKRNLPMAKNFGISPYDPNSTWLRPYMDDDVCWTGTASGAWDEYTQRQYPGFDGWNLVSERTLKDTEPSNDLTPQAAQRLFMWEHRKQGDITKPDYNIDAGFGGPVPFISEALGDLRFYASYRKEQDRYMMRLARDGEEDESGMLKLTSDINPSMKLSYMGIYGETHASSYSRVGGTSYMDEQWDISYQLDQAGFTIPWRIYTDIYWCPTSRYYNTQSLKLTHVLNPTTYYEALIKYTGKKYYTWPGSDRDLAKQYEIFEGYFVDEAPVGFYENALFAIGDYMGMGGSVSTSRDTSRVSSISLKFDLTSQINLHNQIKTGIEFVFDNYDMSFGQVNKALPEGNTWTMLKRKPFRITAYVQDKIEFEGFISTVGLILDYSNPNGKWYDVAEFSREFASQNFSPELDESNFLNADAKSQLTLSPRLAISHPITDNSKLYFNYGHYRQMITSERLFRVQRDLVDKLDYIGDPSLPLERTVSYELGYDHAIFSDYRLHISAYYKDIKDQNKWVKYISYDGKVNYDKLTNNSYEDIRGLELGLTKMWGKWITGDINYEYRVGTSGYFESEKYYENPAEQREFLRDNPKQERPLARPQAKAYFDFHTPSDYGPQYFGQNIIGDWHFNLIARWISGASDTWNPNKIAGIKYNVKWNDYYNFDFKITKSFAVASNVKLKFFCNIYNIFNLKYFSGRKFEGGLNETYAGFADSFDYDYYMKSLHLPSSIADKLEYGNIPGDDQPGDYRQPGVDYQPMEYTADINNYKNPNPNAIYYDAATKRYMEYVDDTWNEVSKSRIDKIIEDKAYIDMPNQSFLTFINPRRIFFGLTLNYHF